MTAREINVLASQIINLRVIGDSCALDNMTNTDRLAMIAAVADQSAKAIAALTIR
jgi:hypothetical protein